MKRGLLFGAALVAVLALTFGRACMPGFIVADYTQVMDTYHLSVICERFGRYVGDGFLPLWLPEFGGGYPGHALSMYGFASPGTLLWALLPLESAYAWSAILHIAFGGVGVYALLREQGLKPAAAMCGGIVFALSEYTVGRASVGHVNQLWALAWAPWVMRATLRAVAGERGAVGWLGVWSGLGLISGHVQLWFFLGPAIAAYAAVEAWGREDRKQALGRATLGALLGLGIAAVQWLPSAELMSIAARPEPSDELFRQWSATPAMLASKVAPLSLGMRWGGYWAAEPFEHEQSGVGGLAVIVLVLLALRRGDARRWYGAALVVVGLVLALGAHTPITAALHRLPVIGWGRVPARTQILTLIGASLLVAHAVQDVTESEGRVTRKRLAICCAVAAAVGLGALAVVWNWAGPDAGSAVVLPAFALSALGAGIALGAVLWVRRTPAHVIALPVALALASWIATVPPVPHVATEFLDFDWAARLPAEQRAHRVHLADFRTPHVERGGVRTYRRLAHVEPTWQAALMDRLEPSGEGLEALEERARGERMQQLMRERAQMAAWLDIGSELWRAPLDRGPPVGLLEPGAVELRPAQVAPVGRALVFAGAVPSVTDDDALARMLGGSRELLLADAVDSAGADAALRHGFGSAEVVPSSDPNEVVYDVTAESAGWLFVTEKYYPGWTATVAGREAEIHRANVAFRAVRVPQGQSRVVMRYRPGSVYGGALLGLLALMLSIGIGVRGQTRKR